MITAVPKVTAKDILDLLPILKIFSRRYQKEIYLYPFLSIEDLSTEIHVLSSSKQDKV